MDALTRRQFDRAMFAKERTLAIRVGDYASRDIKEASFEYGYIKGDTYKPGGTCAGSGKITFTSIITTFNKLDTLHPEIGLLVGDTYQWVKMGEYFINDIEIDRNRNTTTLELMDGMFKLNREYVTDLHFPAEVREVIQEICLKTGIELANDYFGISAMRYHIEQVPEGKKLSFRDMLSAMTQMIGMSCFFNREGKMEIRDLTESNITINADSYFLHGLTKSEIEYQIAGITCKTDKKSLTVGMKTGRSLELDNVFMTQSALNDLYYKLKNLTYYPYNLNYQGHLLLEVGQWVTIQTNKKETFKVPVLSQSFTFKGGLRGRISADSKAGNDTQYSYEGTITKQIKQQDGVEAKIQAQIEAADKDFDQKVDKIKKDFNDQVELAKARAEEVKQELSDTINQRFNSFDNGPLKETKRKAEEALRNAGASTLLAQEAKRIGLDSVARLEAFKSQTTSAQTALSGDLDALKRTIANDIRPKQAQAEAEIAKQAEALSRTKNELAGASTLLAQEAKRIELDSVARLEAFKSQTTSAQTALSGDLDVLKQTIANDIRPKQAQAEAEIAKQVEALSRTKNELAGVKSAQATYKETTTRRLSELTNLANGKASKSELTQTAEELASRIASVKVGGRNYYRDSEKIRTSTRFFSFPLHPYLSQENVGETWTLSFDLKINEGGEIRPLLFYHYQTNRFGLKASADITPSKEWQRFTFTGPVIFPNDDPRYSRGEMALYDHGGNNNYSVRRIKLEKGTLATDWSPAIEDIEGQISTVESNFKQRADSLEAGVSRLTEGLRTKADISALNVTAENIRQSVKSLETDTQNKLNQKLSQAEFEVRAGSIRQEILNATKDKASKSELTQTAEELSSKIASVQVGGRNYIRNGQFKNGSKNWLEYQSVNFGLNFNYQHSQNPNNRNRPGLHFYHDSQDVANFFGIQQSFAFDGIRGEKVSVSLLVSKDGSDSYSGLKVALHYIKNKNIIGQEWQNIPSPQITSKYKRFTFTFTLSDDVENLNLMLFGEKGKTINLYVTDVQLERGSVATDYKEAPEDTDEAIRSVQSQLTGSWAVQNINSAGDIISGINLGANGHNRFVGKLTHITGETLIDRAVIKSAMVDKLKTANFEAGSVTTTILDAEAVTAEKLKVDNALIRKLTATDAFIYELISKRIFSTKVESVISSSTFLEAYQGRIGGFTLGQFDQGGGRWISGVNQFSVGMGNGAGHGVRTAFWANWGNNWNYAGPKAWNVNTDGKMYCRNEVGFYDQVDFSNSSRANFYGNTTFSRSPVFSNGIELGSKDVLGDGWNPKGGRNAVVWWNQVGSGSVKYWMEQKSDRRLKENITDTAVKALDKINRLRMVAFDFIENKKHEEIGLIAQEAETIVPRIVSRDPENPDGYLHIDYTALVPYLIKAIQELNQKIEKMEKIIA
ncbi:tail fiber domain-containing protein [Streptococcus pneumoniae]|uniref:tail fiber domain-containing protein n=2 Tax=Streptococcus pneumoniae TaxID=1313 RepID=UPI00076564DA|nr:tail fiber domain-containing protein [Streptococcus pneumoniae]CVR86924.1 PblB [Streptococcus pneumoniae]